jgi:glutamine amidotransferase
MKVTIFDYGAGNLHSLAKALEREDTEVVVQPDPQRAVETDVLVLPGVGAFGSATQRMAAGRDAMRTAILNGLPAIGICLGMQLLFDGSEEGAGIGLGVVSGGVTLFDAAPLPIAYFANSFVCRPHDPAVVVAWSEHETDRFAAAVRVGRTIGVQFHPEKSSTAGVRFLHAFLDEAGTMTRSR